VTVFVEAVRGLNWQLPLPAVNVPVQLPPEPSVTVTVPVGVPEPGALTVTLKFAVTSCPVTAVGELRVTAVVVPALLMVRGAPPDEELEKCESPE
jgi:hypothetical protein